MSFWKKLPGAKESPKTIHEATKEGDLQKVEALLKDDSHLVFSKRDDGWTPLHSAAHWGFIDIAQLFLVHGADVNARDKDGRTPLHFAALHGHKDVVELLLANGTDVNAEDKHGKTPLHVASEKGHKDVVELLLANKALVDAKDEDGKTPLHMPAKDYKDVAELLLANGADVNVKDNNEKTPLSLALQNGSRELAELLRQHGGRDFRGEVLEIYYAAKNGALNQVQRLLKSHPELVSSKNGASDGGTPLEAAAQSGHKDVAELLLTSGADVNAKDNRGYTPLHEAAKWGHKDVAELLLANRAAVNAKDKFGDTPLHVAAVRGHKGVAELLLANSAELNAEHEEGPTPLHSAAHQGQRDMVELLLANGADVNAKGPGGWTPLHSAAARGYKDVAELLLANKAVVDARSNDGETPLQCAANRDVAELLRQHGGRDFVVEIQDAAKDGDLENVKALLKDNPHLAFRSLSWFISNNDATAVQILLGAGATVDSRTIKMAETAVHQARVERARLCPSASAVASAYGTEAALEYQREARNFYTPRERAVAHGEIIEAAEKALALLQSKAAAPSNPTPNTQARPGRSAVPTLTCAGCTKIYKIGDDAVAVTLEHGLSLARGAVIFSDGSKAVREDLVAGLDVDASPENLAGAREKARQNWKIIQDSLSQGRRRTWCCKACNKVNEYP